MKKIIAIDIGGTNIKWSLLNEKYEIIERGKEPTEAFTLKASGVYEKSAKIADKLHEKYKDEIIGVSVSMPGIIDSEKGEPLSPITYLPNSFGVNVIEEFSKWTKLPIKIINDANAAVLGESVKGNLLGVKDGAMITIGTGIGGGILINGELHKGFKYTAGEFGRHFISKERWEEPASTRRFVRDANLVLGTDKELTGEELFEIIDTDKRLKEIFIDWMEYISLGISNIASILGPEVIVIGGGISENSVFDIEMINWRVNELLGLPFEDKVKILKSKTGNDAALFGAASLFIKKI